LANKPVVDFTGPQFLKILKANNEKLLTYSIDIPEAVMQKEFIDRMKEFFQSEGQSEVAHTWNEEREKILLEALKENLFPLFQNQLKDSLTRKAEEAVINSCAEKLERLLMAGPFKPQRQNVTTEEDTKNNKVIVMGIDYGDPRFLHLQMLQ